MKGRTIGLSLPAILLAVAACGSGGKSYQNDPAGFYSQVSEKQAEQQVCAQSSVLLNDVDNVNMGFAARSYQFDLRTLQQDGGKYLSSGGTFWTAVARVIADGSDQNAVWNDLQPFSNGLCPRALGS